MCVWAVVGKDVVDVVLGELVRPALELIQKTHNKLFFEAGKQ